MSDFWGIAQNRVKTAKNGLIPELSTLVHNLSTISTEVWISLLITCGEAEENPKRRPRPENGTRAKSLLGFGFWGVKCPKENARAAVGSPKVEKRKIRRGLPQKTVRAAARRFPFVKGC
jgi:hypothetical protein